MDLEVMLKEVENNEKARRLYQWLLAQGEDNGKATIIAHRYITQRMVIHDVRK